MRQIRRCVSVDDLKRANRDPIASWDDQLAHWLGRGCL